MTLSYNEFFNPDGILNFYTVTDDLFAFINSSYSYGYITRIFNMNLRTINYSDQWSLCFDTPFLYDTNHRNFPTMGICYFQPYEPVVTPNYL